MMYIKKIERDDILPPELPSLILEKDKYRRIYQSAQLSLKSYGKKQEAMNYSPIIGWLKNEEREFGI